MASVKYDHVTKEFDGAAAVKDLTIEVEDGEFLVLVGPPAAARAPPCACSRGSRRSPTGGS